MRQKSLSQNITSLSKELNKENTYRRLDINLNFGLPARLPNHIHKVGGQTNQHMATMLSPVACAFWGSDKCVLSAPCLSVYLQLS